MMSRVLQMSWISIACALALSACANDFDKPTLISHPMLLGLRASVVGDPQRATPAPGEDVVVQVEMAGPRGSYKADQLSTMMVECGFPDRFAGIPICQEFLDLASLPPDQLKNMFGDLMVAPGEVHIPCDGNISAEALGVTLNCIAGPPNLEFTVREDVKPGDRLLRGVVCTKGQAVFDPSLPELFGCDGGDEKSALPFHTRLSVSWDGQARNNNPDIAELKLTMNGRAFDKMADPSFPKKSCVDAAQKSELILIDPFDQEIEFVVPKKAREKLSGGGRENWELTVYASAGDVLRRFTLFTDEDTKDLGDPAMKSVVWDGSDAVKMFGTSKLVDFWITVRDQRGGFAVLPRSACVELPEALE